MNINPPLLAHCDALALLERCEDNKIDLIYLDPPWYSDINFLNSNKEKDDINIYFEFISKILQQSKRILCEKGTLFFHTQPENNNQYRFMLDNIFGKENNRMEYILKRNLSFHWYTHPKPIHDVILFYSKSENYTYNIVNRELTEREIENRYNFKEGNRRYRKISLLANSNNKFNKFKWKGITPPKNKSWKYNTQKLEDLYSKGLICIPDHDELPFYKQYVEKENLKQVESVWSNEEFMQTKEVSIEKFPTQKPVKLIERIIKIGSDEENIILDPFCGTGTTFIASENLHRKWIGCDKSELAVNIIKGRLKKEFGMKVYKDYIFFDKKDLLKEEIVFDKYSKINSLGLYDISFIEETKIGKFIIDRQVPIEETRHYEFKQITGNNPIKTIENTVDDYAVAFLNSEGGKIYWGINDERKTIGIKITYNDRDSLRQVISQKLFNIKPEIDPTMFRIEFHSVYKDNIEIIDDLFVVEVIVPRPRQKNVYYTGGNDCFVKLDGVKKKLTGPELTEYIKNKFVN